MDNMSEGGIKINVVDSVFVDCLDQEYKDEIESTFTADPKLSFRNLDGLLPPEAISAGQTFQLDRLPKFKFDRDQAERAAKVLQDVASRFAVSMSNLSEAMIDAAKRFEQVNLSLNDLDAFRRLQEPTPEFVIKFGKFFTLYHKKNTLIDFLNENPPKHVSSRLPNLTGEKNESTSI